MVLIHALAHNKKMRIVPTPLQHHATHFRFNPPAGLPTGTRISLLATDDSISNSNRNGNNDGGSGGGSGGGGGGGIIPFRDDGDVKLVHRHKSSPLTPPPYLFSLSLSLPLSPSLLI
jgi:hypothetical protein